MALSRAVLFLAWVLVLIALKKIQMTQYSKLRYVVPSPCLSSLAWARPKHCPTVLRSSRRESSDTWEKQLTVQIRNATSILDILAIVDQRLGTFNSIHSTTCLYQIARLSHLLTPTVAHSDAISNLAAFQFERMWAGDLDGHSVGNTAWALGSLHRLVPSVGDPEFSEILITCAKGKMNTCSPQEVSNLIYGLAKAGCKPDDELFHEMASSIVDKEHMFTPQGLSNMIWGLATMRLQVDPLMDILTKAATNKMHTFTTQALSNVAWAVARVNVTNKALMERIVELASRQAPQMRAISWAHVLLALAKLRFASKPLMSTCAHQLKNSETLKKASRWAVCALVWSCDAVPQEHVPHQLRDLLDIEKNRRSILQEELDRDLLDETTWVGH